eukprot:SAG31_NODE_7586_length_1647_cov_1.270026_1_plen_29_part_10
MKSSCPSAGNPWPMKLAPKYSCRSAADQL